MRLKVFQIVLLMGLVAAGPAATQRAARSRSQGRLVFHVEVIRL
jgi:hypothetical protein